MKLTGIITIGALVVYAALALLQLWFGILPAATFIKLTITFGVVLVVLVVSALIRREYVQEKKQKDEGFLD